MSEADTEETEETEEIADEDSEEEEDTMEKASEEEDSEEDTKEEAEEDLLVIMTLAITTKNHAMATVKTAATTENDVKVVVVVIIKEEEEDSSTLPSQSLEARHVVEELPVEEPTSLNPTNSTRQQQPSQHPTMISM